MKNPQNHNTVNWIGRDFVDGLVSILVSHIFYLPARHLSVTNKIERGTSILVTLVVTRRHKST